MKFNPRLKRIKANETVALDTCEVTFMDSASPPIVEFHIPPVPYQHISQHIYNPDAVNETLKDILNSRYKWVAQVGNYYYLWQHLDDDELEGEEEIAAEMRKMLPPDPECECGAAKLKDYPHSEWCPVHVPFTKYEEPENLPHSTLNKPKP